VVVLTAQGFIGCVSTNATDPTAVIEAINPKAVSPISSGSNAPVYVSATAQVSASGVIAGSTSANSGLGHNLGIITVFASIGASSPALEASGGNFIPPIPAASGKFSVVTGVGALAFSGTNSTITPY
jgi:hypothetical protein